MAAVFEEDVDTWQGKISKDEETEDIEGVFTGVSSHFAEIEGG